MLPFTVLATLLASQADGKLGVVEVGEGRYHCYSCMSESYLSIWSELMAQYFPPVNFTSHCRDPRKVPHRPIGSVPCNGVCLTVVESVGVGGVGVGSRYMRGCVDHMLLFGFDMGWLARSGFTRLDTCRLADRSRFLPVTSTSLRAREFPEAPVSSQLGAPDTPDLVTVCSCSGDRCNDSPVTLPVSRAPPTSTALLGALLPLLTSLLTVHRLF